MNYRRALHINPRDECSQSLLEDAEMELIKSGESAEDIEALKVMRLTCTPYTGVREHFILVVPTFQRAMIK